MKKNKKIWSYALACALAMSNLSVVAAPFSSIVAQADEVLPPVTYEYEHGVTAQAESDAFYKTGTNKADLYAGHKFGIGIDSESAYDGYTISIANVENKYSYDASEKVLTITDAEFDGTIPVTLTKEDAEPANTQLKVHGRKALTINEIRDKVKLRGESPTKSIKTSISTGEDDELMLSFASIEASKYLKGSDAGLFYVDVDDEADDTGAELSSETSEKAKYGNTYKGSVSALSAGSFKLNVMYDPDGAGEEDPVVLSSTTITAKKPTVAINVVEKDKRTNPVITTTGGGSKDKFPTTIELTATATPSNEYGKLEAKELTWRVYKADVAEKTAIEVITEEAGDWDSTGKAWVEKATVDVKNKDLSAGSYVAAAYVGSDDILKATSVKEYPFTIVDMPARADVETDTASEEDTFYVGSEDKVRLLINGSPKTATYALANSTDKAYVELNESTGAFKVIKTNSNSNTPIPIVVKNYNVESTGTLKISYGNGTPGDYYYAEQLVKKIYISQDDLVVTGIESDALSVGSSVQLKAMFGAKNVTNAVEWKSSNTKYATVTSNGVVEVIAPGATVTITATYTSDDGKITDYDTVEFETTSIEYRIEAAKGTNPEAVRPGSSFTVSVVADNKQAVTGNVTWQSSNEKVAVIEGSGSTVTVKIPADATVGSTSRIDAQVGNTNAESLEVAIADAHYEVTDAEGNVLSDAFSLYNKESKTLTVKFDGATVAGTWKEVAGNTSIILKGNVVTATAGDGSRNTIEFYTDKDKNTPVITLYVDVQQDSLNLAMNGKAVELEAGSYTVNQMEVGQSINFTLKNGITDVTNKASWTSKNTDVLTVSKGIVTAIGEGTKAVTIEAKYGSETISIIVKKTIPSTGVVEATDAANAAAEKALAAAKAAEANPTAETVKAAQDAAAEATAAAEAALEASKNTKASEENRKAAKAASDAAAAAAKTATEAATAAQAKVDEAAKKAEEEAAKKAEEEQKKQEEEQKKSDGSAANTPAPVGNELKDAAGATTGFVVTNATPGQATVEYKGNDADKKAKSVTIPDTTKDHSGNEYKVTSIAANAFAGADTTKVTIGKNIKKIDPNAFKSSKVKKVIVKGTKFTKKMAKAINKLKKGSTVKVTGKNKKANKKIFNALKNVKNGKIKVK